MAFVSNAELRKTGAWYKRLYNPPRSVADRPDEKVNFEHDLVGS